MNFKDVFEVMKAGARVKLPSWGGYWYWDPEKETIMMQCRAKDTDEGQGDLLDIRETQRVEYTISNILSDEWIFANETNCPVLGGEATFSFGEAIKYMKRRLKVKRKGWNGKNQYVRMVDPYDDKAFQVIEKKEIDGTLCSYFSLKNEQNEFVPWVPSTRDLLAEDWCFAE